MLGHRCLICVVSGPLDRRRRLVDGAQGWRFRGFTPYRVRTLFHNGRRQGTVVCGQWHSRGRLASFRRTGFPGSWGKSQQGLLQRRQPAHHLVLLVALQLDHLGVNPCEPAVQTVTLGHQATEFVLQLPTRSCVRHPPVLLQLSHRYLTLGEPGPPRAE